MSNKRSMLSKNYKKSNVNSDHIENISTSINQSIQQSNREINRNKFLNDYSDLDVKDNPRLSLNGDQNS